MPSGTFDFRPTSFVQLSGTTWTNPQATYIRDGTAATPQPSSVVRYAFHLTLPPGAHTITFGVSIFGWSVEDLSIAHQMRAHWGILAGDGTPAWINPTGMSMSPSLHGPWNLVGTHGSVVWPANTGLVLEALASFQNVERWDELILHAHCSWPDEPPPPDPPLTGPFLNVTAPFLRTSLKGVEPINIVQKSVQSLRTRFWRYEPKDKEDALAGRECANCNLWAPGSRIAATSAGWLCELCLKYHQE